MFVGGLTGCYCGVLPEAIDRPFRCLYGVLPGLTDRLHRGLYGVLPGPIVRPFKCLYGLSLGVTTRSYQSVLTDLSDVCRRCYWVLLWGLTRGYWPTFQRFVCTLIWACWLSYWSVIGRLTRVLYGPLPRVLLRVCVHGEWVLSSLF